MNLTKIMMKTTLITMMFLGFAGCAKSVEPAGIMSVNETALDGYDPVSYFVSSKAVKAGKSYVYTYKNLDWNFESQSNLETFSSDPDAYIPAFGGFCAYEISGSKLVLSDPRYWAIHDDRLYLFSDEDAKKEWFRDIDSMILKAQEAWKLLTSPAEEEKFEEIGDSFMKASSSAESK